MILLLYLLNLINYCFAITITSTICDQYNSTVTPTTPPTPTPEPNPNGACTITVQHGDYTQYNHTLDPCPSYIGVPDGCINTTSTVCPPFDHCTWLNSDGYSSLSCYNSDCFTWSASGAPLRFICSSTWNSTSPTNCVKTISTSAIITTYFETTVTVPCSPGIPSGCGTTTTLISSTTHTYTTCPPSITPPPGCSFTTTLDIKESILTCGTSCSKVFSYEDKTTTITFTDECPEGEITPPPGYHPENPPYGCTSYSGTTYCPDHCITNLYDFVLYYSWVYLITRTYCDYTCDFITKEATPTFDCSPTTTPPSPNDPDACTHTFYSEGQTTTVTLSPCPLGEITPPPNFPGGIIGCTTYNDYFLCPNNCYYYNTTWTYYGSTISHFKTSCETSGCEIITTGPHPSYICTGSACTHTFSSDDQTTTVTLSPCPLADITPPPNFPTHHITGCTTYSGETYCPDNCDYYTSYYIYFNSIITDTVTSCDTGGCEFITTGNQPSYNCHLSACEKTFTAEGMTTTVTLAPCPLGEITPPPNFPGSIAGCTTYGDHYFCPENCYYYDTTWTYYNSIITAFITSCDNSGCEIVTTDDYPSYSCPPPTSSPPDDGGINPNPTPCTRTFSYQDRTTTVSFYDCPLGEITPPPDLTMDYNVGCTTYSGELYCPPCCVLSGSFINYYGTPYNMVFSYCETSGCEFVTEGHTSFDCYLQTCETTPIYSLY